MPMYEYRCERCDALFEEIKRMADRDQPETCPACGGEARAQISGVAMISSGSRSGAPPACAPGGG